MTHKYRRDPDLKQRDKTYELLKSPITGPKFLHLLILVVLFLRKQKCLRPVRRVFCPIVPCLSSRFNYGAVRCGKKEGVFVLSINPQNPRPHDVFLPLTPGGVSEDDRGGTWEGRRQRE